jgi:long-chain fatty acid transport protein
MTGKATITGDRTTLAFLNMATVLDNSAASTTLRLPGYFMFGGSHNLTSKWTVLAEADYILWSRLQKLTINYSLPGMMPATLDFNYHNTWRLALGQSYQAAKDLILRMGLAWDESPIPNDFTRTARLPSNSRIWASVGATYDIDKHSSISFGYTHIFIKDARVDSAGPNGLRYTANYSGSADLVGMQLNMKFA